MNRFIDRGDIYGFMLLILTVFAQEYADNSIVCLFLLALYSFLRIFYSKKNKNFLKILVTEVILIISALSCFYIENRLPMLFLMFSCFVLSRIWDYKGNKDS